jgi:hypothetical protein
VLRVDVWPSNQVNGVLGYLPLTASSQLASCSGVIWNALQLQTMTPTASSAGAGATTNAAGGTASATATGAGTKSDATTVSINPGGLGGLIFCMLCGILAILII